MSGVPACVLHDAAGSALQFLDAVGIAPGDFRGLLLIFLGELHEHIGVLHVIGAKMVCLACLAIVQVCVGVHRDAQFIACRGAHMSGMGEMGDVHVVHDECGAGCEDNGKTEHDDDRCIPMCG